MSAVVIDSLVELEFKTSGQTATVDVYELAEVCDRMSAKSAEKDGEKPKYGDADLLPELQEFFKAHGVEITKGEALAVWYQKNEMVKKKQQQWLGGTNGTPVSAASTTSGVANSQPEFSPD